MQRGAMPVAGFNQSSDVDHAVKPFQSIPSDQGQPPVPAGKDPKEGPEAVEQVKPWETRLDHCASEKGERRKEKRKKDEKEKHEKKSKRDKKAQKEKEVQPHSSTVGRRGEVVEAPGERLLPNAARLRLKSCHAPESPPNMCQQLFLSSTCRRS